MITRSFSCLREPFKSLAEKWLIECKKAGIDVAVTETCRSTLVQQAYYAQGRKSIEEVNLLRKKAGLSSIQQSQNTVITWTLDSPHLYGVALDFVPLVNGKAAWSKIELFTVAGEIAEKLGLEWGGRWKEKDYPHIQLPNWRTHRNKEGWKPVLG